MRVEKRSPLAKLRRFLVPEDQDYWMYQDPLEEDIKLAKDTSKKKKGNTEICSFQNPMMIIILLINNSYI